MGKRKQHKEKPLTPEEREALGKWARRISQSVQEFEKAAGKPISEDELRACETTTDEDREYYRKGGEADAGGVLRSEQFMWHQLGQDRRQVGEKAFRQKVFSICIDIAVELIAPHLSELE